MNAEVEGRKAAIRFREEHRLGVQPLGDLVAVIEQAMRIDVAVLDVEADEHGLTMRDPQRDVVFIGVARTKHPMRQRSSLAHELGHVIFQDWADNRAGNWSRRSPEEIRADAFARHLLVPVQGLREFLGPMKSVTWADLSAVVQWFLVSPTLAAIALCEAGYIDADTKQDWSALSTRHLATRFGWIDQYRALAADSNRRRAPQRLLARAIRGYTEGVLSAQAIATLRGVPLAEVEKELQEAGLVPAEPTVRWASPDDLPPAPQVDLAALDAALADPDDRQGRDQRQASAAEPAG